MFAPAVLQRLHDAMNRHDIEAFLECFAPDYRSEQPAHPARAFIGTEQVRKNWSALFAGLPNFRAQVLRSVVDADTIWTEWHWQGTRGDGSHAHFRGVTLFGTDEERITWGRLYVEPVEVSGEGIDRAVAQMSRSYVPR